MATYRIIIAILVAIILWLAMCNRKPDNTVPAVIPIDTQAANADLEQRIRKQVIDSLNSVVVAPALAEAAKQMELADYWEAEFKRERTHGLMQADILTQFIEADCPDTSGKLRAALNNYIASCNSQASKCDSTILAKNNALSELNTAISGKDKVIEAQDKGLTDLRALFDTALRQQSILTDYIRKNQPKRTVFLGISGSTAPGFNGIGPALGYQDRKGNQIDYSLQFLNGFNQKQHTLTVKKVLFKF